VLTETDQRMHVTSPSPYALRTTHYAIGQAVPELREKRLNPNRVRDHLANERTYLAWMRTAVALMGFGVLIVRLRYIVPPELQEKTHGWELGLVFTLVGLVTVVTCTAQYFGVLEAIERDTYQPAGRWVVVFSVAVALIGTAVLYVLFTSPPVGNPTIP
jgi:putative membrane protein